MEIRFKPDGPFTEQTTEILEELEADAVILFVFGSSRGSGCCCQIEAPEPEYAASQIINALRQMAESMEESLERGQFKSPDEGNGYNETFE